ncbi:hypothetical protein [Pseudonocardia phyllosphaerae]|uniref:hypothetical protein n=1 Tax=Pseudonocardia phyllosphaerae TaxID=3390502 RepID=UPI003979902B
MSAPNPWHGLPRPPRPEPAPDPDEVRLVGLRRKEAAARAISNATRGIAVRAYDHGWTVSFLSGHYTHCTTLEGLLDAVSTADDRRMLRMTALIAADRSAGSSEGRSAD